MPRHELHELVVGFFFLLVQQPCRAVVKAPAGLLAYGPGPGYL